jgi:putative colanic acid biosynthesis acetyltransferase WcaB
LNSFRRMLFQDWRFNSHDLRMRFVLVGFRLAQWVHRRKNPLRTLLSPYLLLYRIIVFWLFHMELWWNLNIGEGLRIFHGYCLVIHPQTRIGKHVTLRHGVTLGNKGQLPEAPILEDYVEVGAHAIIIGPIVIGKHAVVGAGAVVTKDVPKGAVVAGNPAKIISQKDKL